MKKWYTYIIMLVSVLFTACNMEDTLFPDKECEQEDITVRIVLSMMDSRANTRAYDPPHTDDYETALGNEYYINQYDVEVLVFDNSGNFVERATLVQATGPTPDFHTYELTGTLSNIVEETTYQMVVLANRSGSAYCTNFSNTIIVGTSMNNVLEPLVYGNYTAAFTEDLLTQGSTERIPMWGVVTAELKDEATITVNMLRAMAKVRVNLNAEGYTLAGVTLNQANNGGYFTPAMAEGIKNDGSTESISEARIPSGLTTLQNLPFVAEPGNTGSYVIYVPECYTFTGTGDTRAATTWMTVSVNDELDNTEVELGENNKLFFREYRETDSSTSTVKGEYFDIVRNYFYDYTITAVEDNSGMELTLSVRDWTDVYSTLNYQDDLSYNHGSWTNNTKEGNVITLKNSAAADATDVTAVYSFQINTPQTIEWMAVLEDTEGKFQFDMSQTSGKGTVEGANAIQRTVKGELLVTGSNLKLGVKAINPSESGQYEATLRVYVTYGGKTIELDLTDGDESTLDHFTILHSKL